MTPEQFVYWLQGFFEIADASGDSPSLTDTQAVMIRDHLKEVFHKMTPDRDTFPHPCSVPHIQQQNCICGSGFCPLHGGGPTWQQPKIIC